MLPFLLSGCITGEVAKQNIADGLAYRTQNQQTEGVTTLENGLQYKVLVAGSGQKPNRNSRVSVHYRGSLVDGTEFDSSYARGKPIVFGLTQVIKGWGEALLLMPEGSTWQVVIPPELGYGMQGQGRKIGPSATLVFTIQLIKVINI